MTCVVGKRTLRTRGRSALETFRHCSGGSEVSGHFGTSTEVSKRHFGPKYRTVQPDGPNCAAILKSFTYKLAAKINSRRYGTKLCHSHPRYRYSIKSRNTALFVHALHGITSFALSLMLDTTVCCCCPQKQRKKVSSSSSTKRMQASAASVSET